MLVEFSDPGPPMCIHDERRQNHGDHLALSSPFSASQSRTTHSFSVAPEADAENIFSEAASEKKIRDRA
jgi:hypothetical protein